MPLKTSSNHIQTSPGYISPLALATFWTNLVSQMFKVSTLILAIFVSNVCTLSMSILNDRSSIRGFLFTRATCHSEKTLKAHFVELRVDLGIHSSNICFSSCSDFGGLNRRFGGMLLFTSFHVPLEGLD